MVNLRSPQVLRGVWGVAQAIVLEGLIVCCLIVFLEASMDMDAVHTENQVETASALEKMVAFMVGMYKAIGYFMNTPPLIQHVRRQPRDCYLDVTSDVELKPCYFDDRVWEEFQDVIKGVPSDVFRDWNKTLCGPKPIDPREYRYTKLRKTSGHILDLPLPRSPSVPNYSQEEEFSFINSCVATPLRDWFNSFVNNDTRIVSVSVIMKNDTGFVDLFNYVLVRTQLLYWQEEFERTTLGRESTWLFPCMAVLCVVLLADLVVAFCETCVCTMNKASRNQRTLVLAAHVIFYVGILFVLIQCSLAIYRSQNLAISLPEMPDMSQYSPDDKLEAVTESYVFLMSFTAQFLPIRGGCLALLAYALLYLLLQPQESPGYKALHYLHALAIPTCMGFIWLAILAMFGYACNNHMRDFSKFYASVYSTIVSPYENIAWWSSTFYIYSAVASVVMYPMVVSLLFTILAVPILRGKWKDPFVTRNTDEWDVCEDEELLVTSE